jgi:predicted TIM-barrel fold metal-dependent hydrolase
MRKLDIFTHIMPPAYFSQLMAVAPHFADVGKRMRNVPMLVDLDLRFRVMDRFEDYQQILSLPTPPIEAMASGQAAVDLAMAANDGMAELVERHPERFPGFVASLPLGDPALAISELERAIGALGARGIQLFSNINGRPLSSPDFLPLFEAMARHDLPIWLHPYRGPTTSDYASEDRSQFEIWWTFGWPYETSVAMSRIVFAGLFDRWPALKIITHHMGAMAPYFAGRVGPGWDQLGARTTAPDGAEALTRLRQRPIDYFHMFFADTALFGAYDATVCGLAFFGADRVVFASDAPFDPEGGPMYIRETIGIIERLPITDAERQQIYSENARRILRLPSEG